MKQKKKQIFKVLYFITAACLLLSGRPAFAANGHPDVALMDHRGNPISIDNNVAYSPKQTCGGCHDYEKITNAYHFQQGRTDAQGRVVVSDGFDSKKPWNLSDGMYGKW
jgi:hypothetical protein